MVKPIQRAEIKSFVGGLITDAPRLEYPVDSARSEANFDCLLDGSRRRRKGFAIEGLAYETNTGVAWSSLLNTGLNSYRWEAPGGDYTKTFHVIQIGGKVFIYDVRGNTFGNNLVHSFVINTFNRLISFANAQGTLVMVYGSGGGVDTLEYSSGTNTFTYTYGRRIKIRDVFGIEDTINTNYETSLTYRGPLNPFHYYNLYNQGWAMPRLPWQFNPASPQDAVALANGGSYATLNPSNSDVVWQGMDYRTVSRETVGEAPSEGNPGSESYIYNSAECFNRIQFLGSAFGELPAAKGFFIIDAFSRGSSRVDEWFKHKTNFPATGNILPGNEIIAAPIDATNSGFTCLTEHAGRMFYSGVLDGTVTQGDKRSPNYTSYVFFSQVIKGVGDIVKCYQEGDPTSREGSDVIDTDGGFIKISGAVGIKRLVSLGNKLLVIASNGVWAIVGQEGGFTATNFAVEKISTFGCIAEGSVIVDGRSIYYWGESAIYRLTPNQFGDLEVVDLTTQSLKSYYAGITTIHKARCFGIINPFTNIIHWVFDNGGTTESQYDGQNVVELRFDVNRTAFYQMRLSHLAGYSPHLVAPLRTGDSSYALKYGSTPPAGGFGVANTVKYFGVRNSGGTVYLFFGDYTDVFFRDWYAYNSSGVDAPAHFLTGETTGGDMAVKKQIPYLTMMFKEAFDNRAGTNPEWDNSCIVRVQWDFADLVTSNRWSNQMQTFRRRRVFNQSDNTDSNGFEMVITKNKLRGSGRAFCMYMETEPYKDCHIIGWNLTGTANGVT